MRTLWTATLPLPPSVNEAYKDVPIRSGSKVFCRRADSEAKKRWVQRAIRLLDQLGWPNLEGTATLAQRRRIFTVMMSVHLASWRRDIDNTAKVLIDTVARRLGLNDSYNVHLTIERVQVGTKNEEKVVVEVEIIEIGEGAGAAPVPRKPRPRPLPRPGPPPALVRPGDSRLGAQPRL